MRYVHGSWEHYFTDGRRLVRFAYDTEEERVVAAQVSARERWREASQREIVDIEDSLKRGNEEAIESPKDYGLKRSASLPAWAHVDGRQPPPPPAARRH